MFQEKFVHIILVAIVVSSRASTVCNFTVQKLSKSRQVKDTYPKDSLSIATHIRNIKPLSSRLHNILSESEIPSQANLHISPSLPSQTMPTSDLDQDNPPPPQQHISTDDASALTDTDTDTYPPPYDGP